MLLEMRGAALPSMGAGVITDEGRWLTLGAGCDARFVALSFLCLRTLDWGLLRYDLCFCHCALR